VIEAIVFDLDGVLVQSEEVWDEVREAYVRERGGRYDGEVQRAMMGMSSPEWSRYLHESAGVPDQPDAINAEVVRRMLAAYERTLPLLPGAADAVRRVAARYPLGLASSSNRPLIDVVLERSGLKPLFRATVSSEEVAHGKPAPDVYLARRSPQGCASSRSRTPPTRPTTRRSRSPTSRSTRSTGSRRSYSPADPFASTRPTSTHPLWPPRPIAFESATSTRAWRAVFGT
jgi:hypothetical protein